jgi:hypothetical protein
MPLVTVSTANMIVYTLQRERSMPLVTVSMAIMIVYTLQRLHNFTHRLVISSLAK